jgi:hypothetical protein
MYRLVSDLTAPADASCHLVFIPCVILSLAILQQHESISPTDRCDRLGPSLGRAVRAYAFITVLDFSNATCIYILDQPSPFVTHLLASLI